MAKKESSFKNMVLTLFVVALIASLALGSIYNITKEPIAKAKKEKSEKAIKAVVPEFDTLLIHKILPSDASDSLTFNAGYKNGQWVGTAVESFSKEGYDPTPIRVMVGFSPEGNILNTAVVQQKETPGLGTKMMSEKFKAQFNGVNPANFVLKVKKDGGQVDAITAATISSRAFCDALQRAYDTFLKQQGEDKQ